MTALFLSCLLAALPAATTGRLPLDPAWGQSKIWDDGLAEVATYEARRIVYGRERRFETVVITVKEDHDTLGGVKADPPYEGRALITVLKTNTLSRIQTENYPYDYMTSVFVRRDDPAVLVKLAQSSHEWCGATFKQIHAGPSGPGRMLHHSYFDGQGDGEESIELGPDILLEEQLPAALRSSRLEPGTDVELRLYDSIVTNAARPVAVRGVRLRVYEPERITVPAGSFEARRVEIREKGATGALLMTWWLGLEASRPILKMTAFDGRSMELRSIERRDYWTRQP